MSPADVCSVDACTRTGQMRRGMCCSHYKRARRDGELELLPSVPTSQRLTQRLMATDAGCVQWTGATNQHGYGTIRINGKPTYTHRVAWELANGPIADGLCVLHHCDNPPCAQTEPTEGYPDGHLFLGTKADNSADMVAKGRYKSGQASKTHCPSGHAYDETNTHVRPSGGRRCRACARKYAQEHYVPRGSAA